MKGFELTNGWCTLFQPYQDTQAGGLETWPAHATGQAGNNTSIILTRNKQLVVVNDEMMGKPQMVPKPRFLDQLDGFLKKELKSLGVNDVEPSELRLQVQYSEYTHHIWHQCEYIFFWSHT